jgi:hypothetical protein
MPTPGSCAHVPLLPQEEASRKWPRVKAQSKTVHLPQTPGENSTYYTVSLPIRTTAGRLAYKLRCRVKENPTDHRWTVDFEETAQCGLYENGKRQNLILTIDPLSSYDRSYFLGEQLDGECAKYPDWGASRSFRLRGMKLSIVWSNVGVEDVGNPRITSAQVTLSVLPDASALNSIPQAPAYSSWEARQDFSCANPVPNPRR